MLIQITNNLDCYLFLQIYFYVVLLALKHIKIECIIIYTKYQNVSIHKRKDYINNDSIQ
jgi:hypothetical protein